MSTAVKSTAVESTAVESIAVESTSNSPTLPMTLPPSTTVTAHPKVHFNKKPPRAGVDPTNGGLRTFKTGKLPWSHPQWLICNSFVHVMSSVFELAVLVMTFYWGAYSQNKYFDASLQVDFDPSDLIVSNPEGWIEQAAVDLCTFILCQVDTVSMDIFRIRNITRTKTGIVLLQGIEQVFIHVKNPVVWGLPALSTQYRNMEVVFKNPTADIYDPPFGRFTNGGAGTLIMTPGPLDPFSPSFNFVVACIGIIVFTAVVQTMFICYFDPDTTTDPYPEGWEFEGLDEIEENGQIAAEKAKAQAALAADPNYVEDKKYKPPTDEELKRAATKAAQERQTQNHKEATRKKQSKLRCRRGWYSCCCYPLVIVTFVKTSFRDTRESFVLATTIFISSSCKTIPLTTMFVWLSFSTPRGMTDLILFAIVFQFLSIVMGIVMWERSALRAEENLIVRLMHPAVTRMTGARMVELTSNVFIFGLFTSQYGFELSVPLLIVFDMFSIGVMIGMTWRQQEYKLNNSKTSGSTVFLRYLLAVPVLMVLHFDHIPGRSGEKHSIMNPRLYYLWRLARHGVLFVLLLPGLGEMTGRVAAGWYGVGFTIALITTGSMMPAVNTAMLAWQELLDLPAVGLKIPLPKQCRRETASGDGVDHQGGGGVADHGDGGSTRSTLMAMYGQKANDFEKQGKLNKDQMRKYEKDRAERHARGEYSDDETDQNDDTGYGDELEQGRAKSAPKSYVFEGVDVDRVEALMSILLKETESKCQGCEGLTTSHDDNCQLEEIQNRGVKSKKKKTKTKKNSLYRFERPEEPPEIRGSSYRKHVVLSPQAASLSFDARRLQRLQGKTVELHNQKSPIVKQRVPLSQQASTLHRVGGKRLF